MKKRNVKKRLKYKTKYRKKFHVISLKNYIKKIFSIFLLIILVFNFSFKKKIINIVQLKQYQESVFHEIVSFEKNLNLTPTLYQEFRQINRENKLIEDNIKFKKSFYPDITVIMTIYNQAHCIHKSLRSIQNQSIKNIEIIIIDDCSIDNSVEKIKEYQKNDPRIILISHDSNEGKMKSRSDGIRKARGKYITILDGDDAFIHKDILKNSLFIIQKANLDAVQFNMALYRNGKLKQIVDINFYKHIKNIIYQPELRTKLYCYKKTRYFLKSRTICGKLIKNELFQKILKYIGPEYTEDYINIAEDTIMAISLFHLANSFYLMQELGYYYSFDQKKFKIKKIENKVCKENNKLTGFDLFKYSKFLIDKNNKDDKDKLITYDEASFFWKQQSFNMKLDNRHFELMFYVFDKMLQWNILNQKQKEHIIHWKNNTIQKRNEYNIKNNNSIY